jgi:hypothetical protein
MVVAEGACRSAEPRGWWKRVTSDVATDEYFSALSEGLVPVSQGPADLGLAVRVAHDLMTGGSALPPFVGSKLPEWTAQCVSSPYGVFTSTVPGRPSTPMRSVDGETIAVLSVGSIDWHDGLGESALYEWMAARARERDIEIREDAQLQRVVFEDGAVVGAVFATPDGPYAVQTRYGLTISPPEPVVIRSDPRTAAGAPEHMQVCLVAHTGSRFARVELLAASSDEVVRQPVCLGSGRQVQESLHQSGRVRSDGPRSGKVDKYPPRRK